MISYTDNELNAKITNKLCVVCDNPTPYNPLYCAGNCDKCSIVNCTIQGKPANVPLCKECENILGAWLHLEENDKVGEFLSKIPEVSQLIYPDDKYAILKTLAEIGKDNLRSALEATLGKRIWEYMN